MIRCAFIAGGGFGCMTHALANNDIANALIWSVLMMLGCIGWVRAIRKDAANG